MIEVSSSSSAELAPPPIKEEQLQLHRLETSSMLEATTLVLLVAIAVPLKYLLGMPQATKIMGPIHGIVFLYYCWTVV